MDTGYSAFTGTIPENYERHFVPILFSQYAEILANSVAHAGGDVLELACGTGGVTRALAPKLTSGRYVASDFNSPMLEIAKTKARGHNLEFQVANAMALPFEDAQFSTVVCQFGVMFFSDKQKAYGEVARVLKPGGTYVFSYGERWRITTSPTPFMTRSATYTLIIHHNL